MIGIGACATARLACETARESQDADGDQCSEDTDHTAGTETHPDDCPQPGGARPAAGIAGAKLPAEDCAGLRRRHRALLREAFGEFPIARLRLRLGLRFVARYLKILKRAANAG